ncbi:MAG: hypothetical protein ACE5EC_04610 [Phycisphaerae bacterium]
MNTEDWIIVGFLASSCFALLHLLASARQAAYKQAEAEARARAEAERERDRLLQRQEADQIANNSDVSLV